MDDVGSTLSAEEMAELSALADGTLPAERRVVVEARVAASPELRELVDRQRRAVAASRAAADEPVPASLRTAVDAQLRGLDSGRGRARRLVPRLALGGAGAAAPAGALAGILSGAPAGPTGAHAPQTAGRRP